MAINKRLPWPWIVLVTGLAAAILVFSFGARSLRVEKQAFETLERQRLVAVLGALEARVDSGFHMLEREMSVLEAVLSERITGGRFDPVDVARAMRNILATTPHLRSLSLIDLDNRVVASSHPHNEGLKLDLYGLGIPRVIDTFMQIGQALPYGDWYLASDSVAPKAAMATEFSLPAVRGLVPTLNTTYRLVALVDPAYMLPRNAGMLQDTALSAALIDANGLPIAHLGQPWPLPTQTPTAAWEVKAVGLSGQGSLTMDATDLRHESVDDSGYTVERVTLKNVPLSLAITQRTEALAGKWSPQMAALSWAPSVAAGLLALFSLLLARNLARWHAEQQALAQSHRAAREANAAKTAFIAHVSHELRTPVGAVQGVVQLLAGSALQPEQQQHVAALQSASETLSRMANRVVTVVRAESGSLLLEAEPFNLYTLCHQTVVDHHTARQAHIPSDPVVWPEGLPRTWLGDAGRLRQALEALLELAAGSSEAVALRVHAQGPVEPDCALTFEVLASGVIENGEPQPPPLALALLKAVASAMGGQCRVPDASSAVNEVWALEVTLRASTTGITTEPDTAPMETPLNAAPVRVLVADDVLINQTILVKLLERMGVVAHAVADGLAAVEHRQRQPYDLILMDLQMPGMDGVQATETIRQWESANSQPPVPVVAVTAHGDTADKRDCLAAGMNGFLNKPVRPADIQGVLRQFTHWSPPPDAA